MGKNKKKKNKNIRIAMSQHHKVITYFLNCIQLENYRLHCS